MTEHSVRSRGRRALIIVAVSLLALPGAAPAAEHPEREAVFAAAGSKGPALVRDAQAAIHKLKTVIPQQADTTTEPSIAVNPEDPLNVVAGYQAGRVDAGCAQTNGFATTFDGGKTWSYGPLPKLTTATGGDYPLASDPVVAFGPDDTVYFNSLMCGQPGNDLAFSVSRNGGRTWSKPILVPVERTFPNDDKNWIVVDNGTGAGHHPGRLYMVWDNVAPVVAMYSDDRAQTWNGPFVLYAGQGIGTIPLITSAGDLAVVFATIAYPMPSAPAGAGDFDPESVAQIDKFVISVAPRAGSVPTGGPLVFTPPTTVSDYRGTDVRMHRASEDLPAAAIDPTSDTIYVAWSDNRYREDSVNDIVVARSDTFGVTWSAPAPVNRGKPDDFVEHFTPAIEVGQDGIVRVAYRTQQQAESTDDFSPFVDTWYQESKNQGQKFSVPLKVNRRVRTDVRFATFSRNSAFLGDYSQLAVTGSWTYVVRCEAFRLNRGERAIFPPDVHHQRVWVGVVDSDGNGRP